MKQIVFRLDVEDGWPPVAKEGFPCLEVHGGYQIQNPPLFVKGISVGDVIDAELDDEGTVIRWNHHTKSGNSTIWLLEKQVGSIEQVIDCLKQLGCSVSFLERWRHYSVDVPANCAIQSVDECIGMVDTDAVACAYPSFRHEE